ncbi:uncharacterized protein LOC113386485 [Ctenocephalides felis]|uniref:uncharacterized protein LOC113386485 n=1 Tax=Ctenocephalides felis TaxID=7515 RepID=UPI000E6E560C|nr:uncharacterized protein LOC113386485 [Ctenocephalides felis]
MYTVKTRSLEFLPKVKSPSAAPIRHKTSHDVDEKKGQHAPSSQQGSDVTGRIPQVTSSGESGRAGSGIARKRCRRSVMFVVSRRGKGNTVSTPSPVVKEFGTKLENVVLSEMPPKLQDMDPTQILLLRGKLGADKCRRRLKKIVLFVLSADGKDSVQERTELAENILKSLRLKFSKQDFEIHLVDTNCDDVSNVQARLFAETRKRELKRHSDQCYLVPILLLNSTFGQQLVPFTIEIADFEEALSKLENDKSKELMSKLYQKVTKDKETKYELQNLKSSDPPSDVQDFIKDLSAVWPQDKVLKYLTTALEDLLNEVMKNHEDLLKNMIWLNRMSTAPFNADAEVQKKLMGIVQELKKQVPEKNILKHSPKPSDNHDPANVVQQISAQLLTALTNPIASLIQDHGQTCLAKPSLGISASIFNNIEKQIPEDSLDASDSEDLQKILKYLKGDANHPLVVCGGSFSGKSVLLKLVVQKVVAGSEFWPVDGNLVCRFEDLYSNGSLVQVLEDVADRCKILQDGEATSCKHDLQSYSTIITTSLQSTRKPLLIILDGLDRHQPVDVSWIPQTLPTNVKIIISATHNTSKIGDQDDQCRFYDSLKNRLDDKCFLSIGDLGKRALAPVFNKEYLDISQDEFAKTEDQPKLIYDKVVSFITKLAKEFLEFDVANVLALLVASRAGLLETEILDLLTGCDKLKGTQKQTYDAASVFWTKLYRRMEPFFLHKRDCVSFKNQLVKQAIEHSFKDSIKLGHQILFDYFSGESSSNSSEFYKTDNATNSYDRFISRKHLELPYHHYHLQGMENFINSDYLTTHEWIYKKLLSCQTSALLDDLDLVNSSSSNQHLTILRDFLTLNKKQLDYDTRQLYSLLDIYFESKQDFSKMNGVHHGQVEIKRKFSNNVVQSWYEACKKPPVCTLVVQNLDDLVHRDDDTKVAVGFTALQRLGNGDTGYVTSLSTEREEICVWDVSRCKRVRTLTGITQPLSLCPVDSTRCIVLCGRELRLFNLDLGSSLVKLKGVMNQKMPFYGLHDNGHVVCLSRNRMYVNLMNLESGK